MIGPNLIVRDVALSAGLLVAAVLFAILAFWHIRAATSKSRRLLLCLVSLIGLASIIWSVSEPVYRLMRLRWTIETVESIQQFSLGLSDSDLEGFDVRLDTNTWETILTGPTSFADTGGWGVLPYYAIIVVRPRRGLAKWLAATHYWTVPKAKRLMREARERMSRRKHQTQ